MNLRRIILMVCGATCSGAALTMPAQAIDRFWSNANGGAWNTPGNWAPLGVPGSNDRAFIPSIGTYTVTLNTNPAIMALSVGNGIPPPLRAVTGIQTLTTGFSGNFITILGPGPSAIEVGGLLDLAFGGNVINFYSNDAPFTNSGQIDCHYEGTSNINGAFRNEAVGLIRIFSSSTSVPCALHLLNNMNSTGFVNNGTIRLMGNGQPGVLAILDSDTGLTNNGTVEAQSGPNNAASRLQTSLDNFGSLVINENCELTEPGGAFINRPGGTIFINSAQQFTITHASSSVFTNSGTITLATNASMTLTGMGTNANASAGVVAGSGTLNISGSFTNGGTFEPGYNGTGQLNVVGAAYVQTSSGKLGIDITGAAPGSQYDQLVAGAGAVLAGGLVVRLGGGFVPSINSSFNVVTAAGGVSNTFDVAFLPGFPDARYMNVNYAPQNVSLLVQLLGDQIGLGAGPTSGLPSMPTNGVLADFDNDGDPDLAVTITTGSASNGSVAVLFNAGTIGGVWQGFTSTAQYTVGVDPSAIAAGRFDNNNSIDLAVALRGNGAANGTVRVLLNNGAGVFSNGSLITVGVKPSSIAAANFNGTSQAGGQIDLAVTNAGSSIPTNGTLTILLNQGNGTFLGNSPVPTQIMPVVVNPADVDNDRDIDTVVINGVSNTVTVFRNNGAGTMGSAQHYPVGAKPADIVVGLLNRDGFVDIVTANKDDNTISVLINNPASPGSFIAASNIPVGSSPRSLAILDVDQDGDQDLALLQDQSGQAEVQILRNDTSAAANSPLILAPSNHASVGAGAFKLLSDDLDNQNGDDILSLNTASALAGGGIAAGASVTPLLNITRRAPLGFNVDLGTSNAATAGFGAPATSFGAAAAQPGVWNNFTGATATSLPLVNLAGGATPVTLTRNSALGGDFGFNNANTSGDFELLLDDGQRFSSGTRIYTFNGIPPGRYRVYTYAIAPDSATFRTNISVTGSISANPQSIGGTMPVNNFVLGATHAVHKVIVPNGSSTIVITSTVATTNGTVSGIQLQTRPPCDADIMPAGGNDFVNVDDLLAVITSWGNCPAPCSALCAADLNHNCVVNVDDLLIVINSWGACQ